MKHAVRRINSKGWDEYLTARRPTSDPYVSRSGWSWDLDDAKLFQNQGSATNSARHNLGNDGVFEVVGVEIKIRGVV